MQCLRFALGFFVVLTISFAAHAAARYTEQDVPDGGTVKGLVTYSGPIKQRTILPTRNREICGKARKVPSVVVGDGGAVKDSIVFLKDVASGKSWPDIPRPVINNVNCLFDPHVQVVKRGRIDLLNSDPVFHNILGYYGKASAFRVTLPTKGTKVTKILRRTGPVRTDCSAHGWMRGWVFVVDNPYFMQTGTDGLFSIPDIPPGDYTIAVWQESVGFTEMPISVKAGETTELTIELGS